jgi:hypothetical protein
VSPRGLLATALAVALLPAVAGAVCAPSATGIFPASGIVGTSVTATIAGNALDGGTVTVFGPAGLTASVQASSATALTLHLDLDPAAAPGERLLFVDTPGGSTGVSFTINTVGGPVVGAVSPPLVGTQGVELDATVTGANLGGVTAGGISISGAGVSVLSATPSPEGTSLMLAFGIDPAADLGTHAVTLTAPTGSAVLELYVERLPPTVTAVQPSAGEVGATVPLTITGTHLTGAALVITTPGGTQDVTISNVATPDDSTLTATLTISASATPSTTAARLLVVTTESGQTTPEFFVVPAGPGPAITVVEPAAGSPGDTVGVTLHGLHLTSGVVSAAAPLTIGTQTVVDDETITAQVTIDPSATVNTNQTLTVTTGVGSPANAVFRVIPLGAPFIGEVRPPFGNRGSTFTMLVIGVNLSQVVPGTGIDVLDPSNKIQVSNTSAIDDRTARATITISPTANIGSRNVKVTTSAGSYTTTSSPFRVNNPGQVPSIADVSPHLVVPAATTSMIVTGSNFDGGGVVVTGPGATVSNTVVDGTGTQITFALALAADAPAETRSVIVVTQNGTATCAIASDPSPPLLQAAKLVKTGAVFIVPTSGFRLFVFEFSESPLFPTGLRTWDIADPDGTLTLTRLDANNVQRAFRERHSGWVRVRAVTPTNRIATSVAQSVRQ